MSVLGPAITLDTLVETLVIGVGTLSGTIHSQTLSEIIMANMLILKVFED